MSVGDKALKGCKDLTSIALPNKQQTTSIALWVDHFYRFA